MAKEMPGGTIMRGKQEGLQCVCIYPDGEVEKAVLLLHPVCHTSGQTHIALSITCTYARTSISHVQILQKVKPAQEGV